MTKCLEEGEAQRAMVEQRSRINEPRAPVTLHESPFAIDDHGVPRVGELAFGNVHAGLVSNAFRVSLDVHAVQGSETRSPKNVTFVDVSTLTLPAQTHEQRVIGFRAVLDASQQAHRCVCREIILKVDRIQILHGDPSKNRPAKERSPKRFTSDAFESFFFPKFRFLQKTVRVTTNYKEQYAAARDALPGLF